MKIKLLVLTVLGLCSQVNFGMETPEISVEDITKAACKLVNFYGNGSGFSSKSEKYKDNLVSILLNRENSKKNGDSITFFVPTKPYLNDFTIYTNIRGNEAFTETKIPDAQIKAINEFIALVIKARNERIKQAKLNNNDKQNRIFQDKGLTLKWNSNAKPDDINFVDGRIENINIEKYAPETLSINTSPRAQKQKKSSTFSNIKDLLSSKK